MTPPDSGEREVCGHRDPEWCCTRLAGHSGDHRYWHMRNPPLLSGEREVPNHTVCLGWPTIRRVAAEGGVHFAEPDVSLVAADDLFHADIGAVLPLSLAQRILAALEDMGDMAMAKELRARIPR